MAPPFLSTIEEKIRHFWSRLGAAVERSIGPKAKQPFDAGAILDSIERQIESSLRRENSRVIAPNRVELRFDYETHARMTDLQRSLLERDLQTSLTEFVHNRRYVTAGPIRVDIAFDAFVRHLEIRTRFAEESRTLPSGSTASGTATNGPPIRVRLRGLKTSRAGELQAFFGEGRNTLGLGRGKDNSLVLDDASVSNFHAALTLNPDRTVWLSDLGSSNGTTIDGVRLPANDRRQVHDGERLCFGEIEMTLELSIGEARQD